MDPIFITRILSFSCFSIFMIILLGLITGMFSEYDTKNRKPMGAFLIFAWMFFGALLARLSSGTSSGGIPSKTPGIVNCVLFIVMFLCLLVATSVSEGFATRSAPGCSPTCEKCKDSCKEPCKDCLDAGEYKIDHIGRAGIAFFVLASLMGSSYYTFALVTA